MSANVERSLKAGAEKVTLVLAAEWAGRSRLWHGTTDLLVIAPRDEGVVWTRGWVDEDSDEGRALIAAFDLVHG